MPKLEINNIDIPVSNQVITISKRAYEFTDLSRRNINISNRINLFNEPAIREVFNHPEVVNGTNRSFETLFPAKYYDDILLFDGVALIDEVTKRQVSTQLVDGFKELLEKFKANVNQLSVDEHDFTFGLTAYNSLKQLSSSLWVWPVCNMRDDKTGIPTISGVTESQIKYSRPMFSVREILDLMFSTNNWTYSRTDNPEIDKLLFTSNHESFYVSSYLKTLSSTISVSGSQLLTGLNTNDFENAEVTTASTSVTIPGRKTSIRLRGNITTDSAFEIRFQYGSSKTQSLFLSEGTTDVDFTTNEFEETTSQAVQINIIGTGDITFDNVKLYTLIEENEFGDLDTNPLLGFRVMTYDNLPDVSQLSVFLNTLVLYGGFINTDIRTKTINTRLLSDLSKLKSIDWSTKFIDESESINDEEMTLYKLSFLGYSNDSTLTEKFASFRQSISNERLEDEGFILQIDYSASKDMVAQSETIADLPIYSAEDAAETRLNDLDLRILYYDEVGSASIARFKDISFEQLAPVYFNDLLQSLTRQRVIEGMFELTKLDVIGFDFTRLVYIERFKSYFYVLAIEDYEKTRFTKVRLLKFR